MTAPARAALNIGLMLRENLPQAVRELDAEIRRTEQRLEDTRRERTTLVQIAIASGIDLSVPAPATADEGAESGPEGFELVRSIDKTTTGNGTPRQLAG